MIFLKVEYSLFVFEMKKKSKSKKKPKNYRIRCTRNDSGYGEMSENTTALYYVMVYILKLYSSLVTYSVFV